MLLPHGLSSIRKIIQFFLFNIFLGGKMMHIEVKYPGGMSEKIKPWLLDKLIQEGNIHAFKRSTGWVVVGKYNIRGMGGNYKGPERRNTENQEL